MSESALNPHTAPRDIAALIKETPFKLRLLVQALGGLSNEQEKMAWHNMQTPEARAQHVLMLLQIWDKANPGAASPPPPAAHTNGATAPAVAAPAPAAVSPAQALTGFAAPGLQPMAAIPAGMMGAAPQVAAVASGAAAAVAEAAGESKSRRNPRTSTSNGTPAPAPAGGDAALGAEVVGLLNRVVQTLEKNDELHKNALAKVVSVVEEASESKSSRVTELEKKYSELQGNLSSLYQMQKITLMAFLTFMEGSMGASMTDLLGAAISDSASFDQLVAKATGKG
jgi:hypothetical protein